MTTSTQTQTPLETPLQAAPLDTIRSLYEAFGRGDIDAILAGIDPEVDWGTQVDAPGADLVPMFRNGRGHDAVLHYFGGAGQLTFHTFAPRRFLVDDDTVYVDLELDAEHRTTGRRAAFGEIHRFVVRDGLVVEYRSFVDTATLIELFRS